MRKTWLALVLVAACGDDGGSSNNPDGPAGGDGMPPSDGMGTADGPPGTPDGPLVQCSPVSGTPELMLEEMPGTYDQPILAISPPTDERLFVVERGGTIRIAGGGTFLDLGPSGEDIVRSSGSEEGLLGLAFHPAYGSNRRFYVYYITDAGHIQIDEFMAMS